MSLEAALQANTEALNTLTAAILKSGTAAPKKASTKAASEPAAPAAAAPSEPSPGAPATSTGQPAQAPAAKVPDTNDPEYVKTKELFLSFGGDHGKEETLKILGSDPFKASRLGEVKPEHYTALRAAFHKRAGELKAPPKNAANDLV
jgi:hypothetical protein